MVSTPSTQPPEQDLAAEVAAWRAARAGTFEAWLDTHHDKITTLADFRGIEWPHGDAGLIITMATQEAKEAAMHVLNKAAAAGIPVDWKRLDIRLDDTPLPESPYVRG